MTLTYCGFRTLLLWIQNIAVVGACASLYWGWCPCVARLLCEESHCLTKQISPQIIIFIELGILSNSAAGRYAPMFVYPHCTHRTHLHEASDALTLSSW
jgi:hypothetical protein